MTSAIIRFVLFSAMAFPALAAAQSQSQVQVQEQEPAVAQVAAPADMIAFAHGAKAWADNCSRCHRMRDPKEFTDAQWNVVVTHMRVRAGLSGTMARDIRTFLQGSN